MKRILIRVESCSNGGVGGIETRVLSFCNVLKHNFKFLTCSKFLCRSEFFSKNTIYCNYFTTFGFLKDIFTLRNFEIIESNGLRDNFVATINYIIYYPIYKMINTKLMLIIHGNAGILGLKGIKKLVYDLVLKIGFNVSDKTIAVSDELKDFLINRYNTKNVKVVPNYINFPKPVKKHNTNKFLLVSRIDNAKKPGIAKAIEFCIKNNLELDIYGDGVCLEALKQEYKDINSINILGYKKQNEIEYNEYFAIFAMGRALLEAIANNLIGILIGYNEVIGEITLKIYSDAKYSNFSGRGLKAQEINLKNFGKDFTEIFKKVKNDFDINNLEDYYL